MYCVEMNALGNMAQQRMNISKNGETSLRNVRLQGGENVLRSRIREHISANQSSEKHAMKIQKLSNTASLTKSKQTSKLTRVAVCAPLDRRKRRLKDGPRRVASLLLRRWAAAATARVSLLPFGRGCLLLLLLLLLMLLRRLWLRLRHVRHLSEFFVLNGHRRSTAAPAGREPDNGERLFRKSHRHLSMASKGSAAAASHSRLGEVAWSKMDKIVRLLIACFSCEVGPCFVGSSTRLIPPLRSRPDPHRAPSCLR
jgi:hypothetical protein